jgi:hypothetical protein
MRVVALRSHGHEREGDDRGGDSVPASAIKSGSQMSGAGRMMPLPGGFGRQVRATWAVGQDGLDEPDGPPKAAAAIGSLVQKHHRMSV